MCYPIVALPLLPTPLSQGTRPPGPLPLGVAVIDAAIVLFGKAFPAVTVKHRQQLLGHFEDCIRQAKSARQQAIQINIFTAFLVALKVSSLCVHQCGLLSVMCPSTT